MEDDRLWGKSQIPDAKIITQNNYLGNEKLLQKGSVMELLPEHILEYKRCRESIEYFAENYYTILVKGTQKELMQLWPIQREALQFFQDHNRVVLNASRQTSKTTMVVLFILWKLIFSDGIQQIGLLGNKYELAKLNLKKVQESFEDLPYFLKPFVEKCNESVIILDNKCLCRITSTSSTAFRGSTITSLIIDEAAFINANGQSGLDEEIMQSLTPTLEAAGDDSFCILISTPFGMNNVFARYFFKAKKYQKLLRDKPDATDEDKKGIKTKYKPFEILWSDHPKRDQDWYDDRIIEMGSEQAFFVEFGGSFDLGSNQKKLYDNDFKKEVESDKEDPMFTQTKDLSDVNDPRDKSLKVWEYAEPNHIYSAGVDVAEGVGGCSSTICITDITDLYDTKQVAEYACDSILVEDFALVCIDIFNRYNQCYATVENNGKGGGELITLLKKFHQYPKLICYHHDEKARDAMNKNGQVGITNHHNTKKKVISNVRHFINSRKRGGIRVKTITIRSEKLLEEMDTFIRHEGSGSGNGNWKRESQSVYDDRVDAFCYSLFPLHHDIVERYFNLSEPKFDDAMKPFHIVSEKMKGNGDTRREQMALPANNTTVNVSIYFGSSNTPINNPEDSDLDWLRNF
jgi:hypothetical protein